MTRTLAKFSQSAKLESPYDPDQADQISKDRHSAMVTFSPKGTADEAVTYIESIRTEVNKIESQRDGFYVAELGSVTTEKDSQAAINGMLAKAGMIALARPLDPACCSCSAPPLRPWCRCSSRSRPSSRRTR